MPCSTHRPMRLFWKAKSSRAVPFVPHTEAEIKEMLAVVGAASVDALFDEIPQHLHVRALEGLPGGMSEMEVMRLMQERAGEDGRLINFCGAGAYEHHIPAAVWEIATRGEFYSAYTPYQAEASQGTLQLLYEYQSMMCSLTGMEVSNASLYDGASALAEALLMAVRADRRPGQALVVVPSTVNPRYRKVAATMTEPQGLQLQLVDYARDGGTTMIPALPEDVQMTALVIQQPNFFGVLEDVDALTNWAHSRGALVVAVVNPLSLALLKSPGSWGEHGADIVCGDGQPLGIPLSSGGPYFGFLTTRERHIRQMPGRIVGRTLDLDGHPGYALTLQAREQHIRRSKATSNICTNQGLLVTAATIYMSLLGPRGLERTAAHCVANTRHLVDRISRINGVTRAFNAPYFHEAVLQVPKSASMVLSGLTRHGILGGCDLSADYPELGHALLVCATEVRTEEEISHYLGALDSILN